MVSLLRPLPSLRAVAASAWDGLLQQQAAPTPFMRHAYLLALEESGSAVPATGWAAQVFVLEDGDGIAASCVVYVKNRSYGEYVFDWAWADAYARHGQAYYPKAVIAVPFTPVPGSRLLARDAAARRQLLCAVRDWCQEHGLSSLHLLFGADDDIAAARACGLMQRASVQFHWTNIGGQGPAGRYADFDDFLRQLNQAKRKKIRQERRRVHEAGIGFRTLQGRGIGTTDWDFFYRCYAQTYQEHGNPPYLSRDFFRRMQDQLPDAWLLFIAEYQGEPVAASLIALEPAADGSGRIGTAYGRYWGAIARVDSLHFEACYYQPLQWCIAHGVDRFEGGAQGEHKMARALMPVATASAHWLAHPAFADAVDRFLARERSGMAAYLEDLERRSPFREYTPGG